MNYLRYAVNRGGSGDGTSSLLHDVFARSAKWASLKYSAIDRERFLQAFRVEVNPDIIFSQKLPGECHVEAAVYIPKLVSVINTTVDVAGIDTVRLNVLVDRWGNIFVENPAPVKEGRLKESVKLPYKLTDQEWGSIGYDQQIISTMNS